MTRPDGSTPMWRRVAGPLFVLAAFLFLGSYVARHLGELRAYDWQVRPGLLTSSVAVYVLGLAWGVGVWQLLLRRMGFRLAFGELARIWFVSGLGRYIPGKIWQFVGAAHLGAAAGVPPASMVTALAAHTAFFLLGALLTGIYLVPASFNDISGVGIDLLRVLAPATLVLVHPRIIDGGFALIRRVSGRDLGAWHGRWVDGLLLVTLSIVSWVLTGIAFHMFASSLTGIPTNAMNGLIGIHALAFIAGYLVFFVPAGLGAKEGALAAMLTVYIPPPVAAVIALAARLWTVVAEVLPALVLLLLHRARQGEGSGTTSDRLGVERRK